MKLLLRGVAIGMAVAVAETFYFWPQTFVFWIMLGAAVVAFGVSFVVSV
jgi:hypothetical protein